MRCLRSGWLVWPRRSAGGRCVFGKREFPALSLLLLAAMLVSPQPVTAQEKPGGTATQNRCQLLGPLAISSYIALLEQIARNNRMEGARQTENAANVMALYSRLDCPQAELTAAIECLSSHVVQPSEKKPISAIAQQCMKQAGMSTR